MTRMATSSLSSDQNDLITAEVERLLGGRTRDIHLKGGLLGLFQERTWPRSAKIIRSWMIWVALLDVLTFSLNAILLPKPIAAAMFAPACLLAPAALLTAFVWRKPRRFQLERMALVLGLFLILLSVALMGVRAGGEFYERNLNVMLFVAITAIIIFAIPLIWTMIIAGSALGLYVIFQLINPSITSGSFVAAILFFASGIISVVVARRTMTIFTQKTFLLELRNTRQVADLAYANKRLELLATTDPLTGIANRRWMMALLERVREGKIKCEHGLAILMCDIDHFKQLNDKLGHAEGDRCLVKVAGIIQSSLRENCDHVSRHGGEEFLVVLPDVDEAETLEVAERIRKRIENACLPNPASSVSPFVTVSIGAVHTEDIAVSPPEELQNQADEALYVAKRLGRNRIARYNAVFH